MVLKLFHKKSNKLWYLTLHLAYFWNCRLQLAGYWSVCFVSNVIHEKTNNPYLYMHDVIERNYPFSKPHIGSWPAHVWTLALDWSMREVKWKVFSIKTSPELYEIYRVQPPPPAGKLFRQHGPLRRPQQGVQEIPCLQEGLKEHSTQRIPRKNCTKIKIFWQKCVDVLRCIVWATNSYFVYL